MSKSNEELNALKKEINNVNEKLQELTPEELEQVTGGYYIERKVGDEYTIIRQKDMTAVVS